MNIFTSNIASLKLETNPINTVDICILIGYCGFVFGILPVLVIVMWSFEALHVKSGGNLTVTYHENYL